MTALLSPLRYPGGKGILGSFLEKIITINGLRGGVYYELYCGGAGAALHLLSKNTVERVVINDADYRIFAFWFSILNHTGPFLNMIEQCAINVNEWYRHKAIYENAENENILDVGFATFFLNRTNRSGVLHNSGPIGGFNQNGNYLIDVRFNKQNLKQRICDIANLAHRITLSNLAAEDLLENPEFQFQNSFIYLDPPYYKKGRTLYLNNYAHNEHNRLSQILTQRANDYWITSYDNAHEIKELYDDFRMSVFDLNYSLQEKRKGSELMIFSNAVVVTDTINIRKSNQPLILF